MFISMTLVPAMNASGAGGHGWAAMNSSNMYGGGDGCVSAQACVRECVRKRVRACVYACVRTRMCACVNARAHVIATYDKIFDAG